MCGRMCVAMPRRDAMGGSSRSGKVHDDGREPAQPVPVLWSKEQKVLIDKLIGDAFSRSPTVTTARNCTLF